MLTLTFSGQGLHDYDKAYELVSRFLNHHRPVWLTGYLGVPELHPGGHGWHWHILHSVRPNKKQLRELRGSWTAFLRRRGLHEGSGSVRVHLKYFSSARVAARYAAKYVGKALGEGLSPGRHRYLRSLRLSLGHSTRALAYDCLDDVLAVLRLSGWDYWDGREHNWGLFIVGQSP